MRMRLSGKDPVDRWAGARPLALLAACFTAGLIAGHAAPMAAVWGLGALGMAALFLVFRRRALAFALAMLLGAAWMGVFMRRPAVSGADEALLTGRIDAPVAQKDYYYRARLGEVRLDGEPQPFRVMLYLYDLEEAPPVGAEITAVARTWIPSDAGNPDGFDYSAWLWRQRVALCASAGAEETAIVEEPGRFSLAAWVQAAREKVADVVRAVFDEDCAGVVVALVTGDKSEMDEESRANYRASGVSHLLALSGLHVSVLFFALDWLLRRLRLSRRAAFFCLLPAMAAYALLVGAPASVLRACLMYAAARAARLAGRPRDGLNAVCLSALALLIVNPLYIEDTGFVLSYSAVLGLMLFGRRWPERETARRGSRLEALARRVGRAARASLAAQAGGARWRWPRCPRSSAYRSCCPACIGWRGWKSPSWTWGRETARWCGRRIGCIWWTWARTTRWRAICSARD